MNTLKQLLFAVAVMICFSMTASAQKDPDKNPPPKAPPPIIIVQPKPTPDKPKDDKKKPESLMFYFRKTD